MLKIKLISPLFILAAPGLALAQDTGQFQITKTSFKELYNNYRVASPKVVPWAGSFFPYADKGTAVKLDKNGKKSPEGTSPMEAYGLLKGGSAEAQAWEEDGHACDKYDAKTKKNCKSWWGHCNGWAAAAIKEQEPRRAVTVGRRNFTVAEQKGILSELWLSSYSMNAGITDKNTKTGRWVHDHNSESDSYRNFWDVTPRAFFLIFTNYVGALKTGLVIDRFTGDEVWNQPIVGYRLLPIRSQDISEVRDGGRSYWSVKLRIKIYWANDLDTPPGHVSTIFNIERMRDSEDVDSLSKDYEGRYMSFRLNFDSKVTMSSDGKKVLSAGKIVGDGLWEHQENSRNFTIDELNHSHPDFIWLPTTVYQDASGYGNPYIDAKVVQKMTQGMESSGSTSVPVTLNLSFAPRYLGGSSTTPEMAKKVITKVIRREGLKHAIYLRDIVISRNKVTVPVRFPLGADVNALSRLFDIAGMPVSIAK